MAPSPQRGHFSCSPRRKAFAPLTCVRLKRFCWTVMRPSPRSFRRVDGAGPMHDAVSPQFQAACDVNRPRQRIAIDETDSSPAINPMSAALDSVCAKPQRHIPQCTQASIGAAPVSPVPLIRQPKNCDAVRTAHGYSAIAQKGCLGPQYRQLGCLTPSRDGVPFGITVGSTPVLLNTTSLQGRRCALAT